MSGKSQAIVASTLTDRAFICNASIDCLLRMGDCPEAFMASSNVSGSIVDRWVRC